MGESPGSRGVARIALAAAAMLTMPLLFLLNRNGGAVSALPLPSPATLAGSDISAEICFDGQYTIARLVPPERLRHEDWHLLWSVPDAIGADNAEDGSLVAVFATAGRHEVSVLALNPGNAVVGQARGIVPADRAAPPAGARLPVAYRTLEQTGDLLAVDGPVRSVKGGTLEDFPAVAQAGRFTVLRARSGGYFRLDIDGMWQCYVFVSPVPSRHLDRADRDWYLTQYNTETTSNCGPSAVAMGINWATGRSLSVIGVRQAVGWEGSGAVSMEQLAAVCRSEGVDAQIAGLRRPADIFDMLEEGRLLIVSYEMAGLSPTVDPVHDLMGQYYTDRGGHYLAIKGYSLDRRWVVVHDPIPSDWALNALRYPDGASMIGRNRYYPIDELWPALNARQALAITPR
jgi:hypothetical protein